MVQEKFDAIVVGAGPAGLAVYHGQGGLKVIVFERGEHPGSKNVMGGVLSQATEDVFGILEGSPFGKKGSRI